MFLGIPEKGEGESLSTITYLFFKPDSFCQVPLVITVTAIFDFGRIFLRRDDEATCKSRSQVILES